MDKLSRFILTLSIGIFLALTLLIIPTSLSAAKAIQVSDNAGQSDWGSADDSQDDSDDNTDQDTLGTSAPEDDNSSQNASRLPVVPEATEPKSNKSKVSTQVNPGRFLVKYTDVTQKIYQPIKAYLLKDGFVDTLVESLNEKLLLPTNITIVFTEDEDMYYQPETKEIHIGYNVIPEHEAQYLTLYPNAPKQEAMDFAIEAVTFFTFHELGHALIDVYDLPAVGNEETDGDTLAAIIVLEYYENGLNIILDAATVFDVWDEQSGGKYTENDFEDEHALNPSRFYNILCLALGYNPSEMMKVFKELENKNLLAFGNNRQDFCTEEYARQRKAWLKLLEPHLR
jgi:hypothetical protein